MTNENKMKEDAKLLVEWLNDEGNYNSDINEAKTVLLTSIINTHDIMLSIVRDVYKEKNTEDALAKMTVIEAMAVSFKASESIQKLITEAIHNSGIDMEI